MRALTPAASRTPRQASPVHLAGLLDIQSPTTSCARTSRSLPPLVRPAGSLPSQASPIPLGGSPQHAAESGSYSYRLSIRLQLLPTPSRCDATIPPLERRSCFRLHVRWLHAVRTHTVL